MKILNSIMFCFVFSFGGVTNLHSSNNHTFMEINKDQLNKKNKGCIFRACYTAME